MISPNTKRWLGTFATSGVIAVLTLVTGVIVARLLLPEGRGLLATAMFWPMFIASVGLLSLPGAITYHAAERDSQGARAFTATAFWVSLALSAILAAAGVLILPWVIHEPELFPVAQWYMVVLLPLHMVSSGLIALDHGRMRFVRYNLLRLTPPGGYLLAVCLLWALGNVSVATVLSCHLAAIALTAAIRVAMAGRELCVWPSASIGRRLLLTGLRFHSANIVVAARSQVDRLLVVSLFPAADVGQYVVAFAFAGVPIQLFTGAFGALLFPRISQAETIDEKNRLLAQSSRYAMLFFVVAGIGAAGLAPLLIPLLFGATFGPAVGYAQALAIALAIANQREIYVLGLMGYQDWKIRMMAEGLMLILFAASVAALAGLGIIAIPVALAIGHLVSLIFILSMIGRKLGADISDHWGMNARTLKELYELYAHARRPSHSSP